MILFSAEAILALSTSKFGIDIPRIDDEDLNSSTESTISTSLIHCIASVGNCEQVYTSVLNLVFQQANVAGVGNFSDLDFVLVFHFPPLWSNGTVLQLTNFIDSILEDKLLRKMHVGVQKRFPKKHVYPKCLAAFL